MDPTTQRSIAERAATQLGHITRSQLLAMGLSRRQVALRARSGALMPVGSRTFRMAGVPSTWEGDVMAACLQHGGIASHRTAARLHGLHGFERATEVEVTAPEGSVNGSSPIAVVHRTTSLPAYDIAVVSAIPVTSVARTFLGLAALEHEVSVASLRDAVDVATRDGLASERWLWWLLESRRCRGRNGVRRLEAVLDERADHPTESWLEREFLKVLGQASVPLPAVQRRVAVAGSFVARVDCCYEADHLVIELKGHRAHSTVAQLESDARRENALVLAGYRLLSFTFDDVVRKPDEVVANIRAALQLRTAC